jgi:hypothetical protein
MFELETETDTAIDDGGRADVGGEASVDVGGGESAGDEANVAASVEDSGDASVGDEANVSGGASVGGEDVGGGAKVGGEEDVSAPEAFDWNGELESLGGYEWYKGLNQEMQGAVRMGLEAKYQNWQRGYTEKFQAIAQQRRDLNEQVESVRKEQQRVQKWLHGDIDPLIEKQKEIDDLKVAHGSAQQTLRREFEEAKEKLEHAHSGQVEELSRKLAEANTRVQEFESAAAEVERQRNEERIDLLAQRLEKEAPEIFNNNEALDDFVALCQAGRSIDDAMALLKKAYAAPESAPEPEPEPEPVPEGMKLMNMGPDTAESTTTETNDTYTDIMEQKRREALREQRLLIGG